MEGERVQLVYSSGIVILLLFIWFFWRVLSRNKSIPCPSWLYWAVELENPLARGSQSKSIISGLNVEEGNIRLIKARWNTCNFRNYV